MKLLIDSQEDHLSLEDSTSFMEFCNKLMTKLLAKDLSVAAIKMDGKLITDTDEMQKTFKTAQTVEIETTSLKHALHTAVSQQYSQLQKLAADAEALVTDCLLDEPQMIVDKWYSLCERLKNSVSFVPTLAPFLKEEQVDHLIDKSFEDLNSMIKELNEVLNRADVVKFSDVLEMKLIPWLKTFGEFMKEQLAEVDCLNEKANTTHKIS
jgi:anaerobic glycerol-3-phosphate dehydrogenase